MLSRSGADINIVDPDRHSPLVLALINGHVDVAAALIDAGAIVNMQDKVGRTALWAAVDRTRCRRPTGPPPRETDDALTSMDVITKLLDRGANVDVPLRAADPVSHQARSRRRRRARRRHDAAAARRQGRRRPVIKLLLDEGRQPAAGRAAATSTPS